jgi:hypothetical protein
MNPYILVIIWSYWGDMDTKYPSCHHSIQDHPYYDVVHYETYMSYMAYSHNVIHIYIYIYIILVIDEAAPCCSTVLRKQGRGAPLLAAAMARLSKVLPWCSEKWPIKIHVPKEKKETYCRNMKTKGGNHVSKTIEISRTYIWKRLEP